MDIPKNKIHPTLENTQQFELLMKAHNNITSILPFFSFVFSLFFFFSLSLSSLYAMNILALGLSPLFGHYYPWFRFL
jgi:hypothetical protein